MSQDFLYDVHFKTPWRPIECVSTKTQILHKQSTDVIKKRSLLPRSKSNSSGFHKHYSNLWGAFPHHFASSFTVQWKSWFPQESSLLKKELCHPVAQAGEIFSSSWQTWWQWWSQLPDTGWAMHKGRRKHLAVEILSTWKPWLSRIKGVGEAHDWVPQTRNARHYDSREQSELTGNVWLKLY